MFEDFNPSQELSQRLKQDMNSPRSGGVSAVTRRDSSASPAEDIFSTTDTSEAKVSPPADNSSFEHTIETAPFVSRVSDWRRVYLVWLAGILMLAPVAFWLASWLYVIGVRSILLKLISAVPFVVWLALNAVLPVLAIILSLVMLRLTQPVDKGRGLAKVIIILAVVCLLSLMGWVLDDIFINNIDSSF